MIMPGSRNAITRSALNSVRRSSVTWSTMQGCTRSCRSWRSFPNHFNSKYYFGSRVPSHLSTSI